MGGSCTTTTLWRSILENCCTVSGLPQLTNRFGNVVEFTLSRSNIETRNGSNQIFGPTHRRSDYSILNTNSCVARISVASAVHLYCIMAAFTAAWNTRGPDRIVTSCTAPFFTSACALTTPSDPS